MWAVPKFSDDRLELDDLSPEEVLDFYDSPKLFTVRDRRKRQLLVYQCGQDDSVERFLVIPTGPRQLADLKHNRISLRDALTNQGWTWLIDLDRSGQITNLGLIDPMTLPTNALPVPGAFLSR